MTDPKHERRYWIRTEQGRVWGPFPLAQVERLKSQLTDKAEASFDGKAFRPASEFLELKALVTTKPAPPPPAPRSHPAAAVRDTAPAGVPKVGPALRALFGEPDKHVAPAAAPAPPAAAPVTAAAAPAPAAPARVPPPPPQAAPDQMAIPAQGEIADISPLRLYALAGMANATGRLELRLETGKTIALSFRRGAPEHLTSDDPELSVVRFLQNRKAIDAAQAQKAEDHVRSTGVDAVTALFQLQLIPPADAHRWMGDHARFLLDRALECGRGAFAFQADVAPPAAAFPLGPKWTLLAEAVRRLDHVPLRARLGKRLTQAAMRSGGLAIGKVEELALNAQEVRVYAAIDGTRTGEQLLQQFDGALALRVLYLLSELKHVSFDDVQPQAAAPPPAAPPAAAKPEPTPPRVSPAPAAKPSPPKAPAPAPAAKPIAAPRPIANYAAGPAGETPEAMLARLRELAAKLDTGTHYEALGLDKKASTADVKRAFVVLARDLHPDTVTDPAQTELRGVKERLFARVNEAAQVLGDDARRKEYEAELKGEKRDVDVSRIFDAEEKFQKAEIFVKARKYKEGLDLLEEAIKLNGGEAEFYAWRGYARFLLATDRKAAFDDCAADCRKAIKMVERCVPAHLFLGHMQKIVGDVKSAGSSFSRVLQIDERNVEAQRELRLMGSRQK
jgi:DnaJ domain